MADSIRLQCLNKIMDLLAATSGIGDTGGPKRAVLEINRFPAGFVQPGPDRIIKELNTLVDRDMSVDIFLWFKTETNPLQAMEEFLPKVQKQLASDHTLGGLCIDFSEQEESGGWSEPFPLVEGQPDSGIIGTYRCLYRTRRDDPFAKS